MNGPGPVVLEVLGRSAGGIARHVAQVVDALDGVDGMEMVVVTHPDTPIRMPKRAHEIAIPEGPISGHRKAVKDLRKLMRSEEVDVVHAHGLRAGIDAAIAARGLGVEVLLTVHNLVRREIAGRTRAYLYRWGEVAAVRLADHTFCVSEDIARHLRSVAPSAAARIEVLYLGIDPPTEPRSTREEIRRDLGVGDGPLIATAARLSAQKSLDVLLDALRQIPNARLLIMGEGPLEGDLRTTAASLGVAERVRWLGFRDDATDVIAAADAFCLSSVWEGVPLSAQEAILLGTPVVATAVGGLPELIADGHSGRLVDSGDADALAAALTEVLADEEQAERYARAARSDLLQRFSTERMLERLKAAYTQGVGVEG